MVLKRPTVEKARRLLACKKGPEQGRRRPAPKTPGSARASTDQQVNKMHAKAGSSTDHLNKRKSKSSSASLLKDGPVGRKKEPDLTARIVEHHRCPITQQLLVDPVVAEDGHVYERRAIENWLAKSDKSPKTNKPMGSRLVPAFVARQTVNELVESGVLDKRVVQEFYMERGRLRATRVHLPGPDLEGAMEDFERARSLGSQNDKTWQSHVDIIDWVRSGVDLFSKAGKSTHSGDLREWLLQVSQAAHVAVIHPLARRLATWELLAQGSRVRVIDDVTELQRLCKRPPPGAKDKVGWVNDMAAFAGQVCTVEKVGDATHMNYCLRLESAPDERGYSFPYDTVITPA